MKRQTSSSTDKHMNKVLFRILPIFFAIILISCTKEEVTPTTPGGTSTVQVKYHVYAASGNVTVFQMVPAAGSTQLSEEKLTVNRMNYEKEITVTSGAEVSLKATNYNPGPEEVTVEIYINNVLAKVNVVSTPGATAEATVIAQ